MNKDLIINRFAKASVTYSEEATVQRQIAAALTSLMEPYVDRNKHRRILEIGCGTGIFSRMLIDLLQPECMQLNDICRDMKEHLKDITGGSVSFEAGDAENYPFGDTYNLIASSSVIQWFRQPDTFFARMHQLLTGEGILAFSTFGKENVREVTSLTGQGLSYLSLEELKEKLSRQHYDLLYAGEEKIIKTFNTPREVLYHLKRTGVTGINRQKWTKSSLQQFCEAYDMSYRQKDKVALTYHPIYIIAKKKKQ